jgi:hypothetical protein
LSEKITKDYDKISILFLKKIPDSKESYRTIFMTGNMTDCRIEEKLIIHLVENFE